MLILIHFLDHMRPSAKRCYVTNSQKNAHTRARHDHGCSLLGYVCNNNIIITPRPHVRQMLLFLFLRVATTTAIIYTVCTRAPCINKSNDFWKPTTVITKPDVCDVCSAYGTCILYNFIYYIIFIYECTVYSDRVWRKLLHVRDTLIPCYIRAIDTARADCCCCCIGAACVRSITSRFCRLLQVGW